MTNTPTEDVQATVEQIRALTRAGCEIIRCAVPTMEAAAALKEIKKQIEIPLVADIHFDYRLAIAAIENGADKIRINPGNIGSRERIKAVVDLARERGIPIRVGAVSYTHLKEMPDREEIAGEHDFSEDFQNKIRKIGRKRKKKKYLTAAAAAAVLLLFAAVQGNPEVWAIGEEMCIRDRNAGRL